MKKTSALSQEQHLYSNVGNSSGDTFSPVVSSYFVLALGTSLSAGIFAVGFSKSPHYKGSIHDADFWFSVQASIAQMTCLVGSTLVTWRADRALTWHWLLPAGIASFCTLCTAPLYILTPTEWSSFSALVATVLQSVLVLHPFLFMYSNKQDERDRKSK
jgi:hypothetical protein